METLCSSMQLQHVEAEIDNVDQPCAAEKHFLHANRRSRCVEVREHEKAQHSGELESLMTTQGGTFRHFADLHHCMHEKSSHRLPIHPFQQQSAGKIMLTYNYRYQNLPLCGTHNTE